jgi:hypothetical protein
MEEGVNVVVVVVIVHATVTSNITTLKHVILFVDACILHPSMVRRWLEVAATSAPSEASQSLY